MLTATNMKDILPVFMGMLFAKYTYNKKVLEKRCLFIIMNYRRLDSNFYGF